MTVRGELQIVPAGHGLRRCLTLLLYLVLAHPAGAQWPAALPASDTGEISRGRVVMIQRDVEGTPWPRVRLHRFIDATPEQSIAMLADYAHRRTYLADLKEVRIERQLDSGRIEVFFRYASNVPLVPDVSYTLVDRLHRDRDGSYSIGWTLRSGKRVKRIDGNARFSRWTNPATGRVGTLLTYDNYVVPDFRFASVGVVRHKAIAAMGVAVEAIAVEVERELAHDAPLLERQVAALRVALAH